MKYDAFKKLVQAKGWTVRELRFDVKPSSELLELVDRIGLNSYEWFVLRYVRGI